MGTYSSSYRNNFINSLLLASVRSRPQFHCLLSIGGIRTVKDPYYKGQAHILIDCVSLDFIYDIPHLMGIDNSGLGILSVIDTLEWLFQVFSTNYLQEL